MCLCAQPYGCLGVDVNQRLEYHWLKPQVQRTSTKFIRFGCRCTPSSQYVHAVQITLQIGAANCGLTVNIDYDEVNTPVDATAQKGGIAVEDGQMRMRMVIIVCGGHKVRWCLKVLRASTQASSDRLVVQCHEFLFVDPDLTGPH